MLNIFKGNSLELLQKELLKNKIDNGKVEKLLKSGIDINSTDEKGRTILFPLCAKKKIDAIKILIENGIDLNKEDRYGKTVLNEAISKSDGLMIRFLIDNGIPIDSINSTGRTILQDVALEENYKVFQILMKYNPNFDMKDSYGRTVLFDAVNGGDLNILREVLNHIEDIDLKDVEGQSALFIAVLKDNPQLAKTLLSHGADVNILDSRKRNTMFYAITKGAVNLPIIEILLNKNIKLNTYDIDGYSLLDELLKIVQIQREGNTFELEGNYKFIKEDSNYLDVSTTLVEHGLNIDKIDKDGKAVITYQIEAKDYEAISFLLECGANINVEDKNGRIPLFYAVKKGLPLIKMIEFLIENGADLEHKNLENRTVVDDIIQMSLVEKGYKALGNNAYKGMNRRGDFQEVLKRVFKYKPNLDIKREDGRTALFDVVTFDDLELIKLLFNFGVNPNISDDEGNTPLSLMTEEGLKIQKGRDKELFLERLVFVLKFRVDVDAQDVNGRTILHKAVMADDLATVEKILSKKADISIKDKQGRTALHHTQWKGNYKIARWLISAGANMDEADNSGFTLLNYAAILGHTKLVVALISAGVLMYNKNPKSRKVALFFKDREDNLEKLLENNITDSKMRKALEEVADNLKKEIKEVLER
jgi:ankyrin repeat protein